MTETFRVKYTPKLGNNEKPYKLLFYFGGFDLATIYMTEKQVSNQRDYDFTLSVSYPNGIQRGISKLPYDMALVCIATVRFNSEDDPHMDFHGSEEAGTVMIPLRGFKRTVATLEFKNAKRNYPGVDFTKGTLDITIVEPISDSLFLPKTKFSISHELPNIEDKKILVAAIIGQQHFGQTVPALYEEIEDYTCMPPWEFDKLVLPGFMLSCDKVNGQHDHDWWSNLLRMGVTRSNPRVSGKDAETYLLEQIHDDRQLAGIATNACSIPTNYWRYGADETQVKAKEYPCENYTLLSRAKLGSIVDVKKNGKQQENYVTPIDDCENDGKDIQSLLTELSSLNVNPRTHPMLSKVQAALHKYVVVQSLEGVYGAAQTDGGNGDFELGLHSMTDLVHKQHFASCHGRINKARPLFAKWMHDYDPDAPMDPAQHIPIKGEGTGLIDSMGNDERSRMGEAYKKVFSAGKEVLSKLKTVMPTSSGDAKHSDNFYVAKVSMVVPHLVNSGHNRCVFTPVTMTGENSVSRMIADTDFMTCSERVAFRVEPEINLEQAQLIQHIHSFYPPVPTFQPPEPFETSAVRQRIRAKMDRISAAFNATNRSHTLCSNETGIADFYAAYYQITDKTVQGICDVIRSSPFIVGVRVEEEPVARYLGGYRVAFEVDLRDSGDRK